VLRKQGPRLLGRGNIPGALSKAPPCNLRNLNSLRHGYHVACATVVHCLSSKFRAKVSCAIYHSSADAMTRCYVIVILMKSITLWLLPYFIMHWIRV
jgi:hypothetical protein